MKISNWFRLALLCLNAFNICLLYPGFDVNWVKATVFIVQLPVAAFWHTGYACGAVGL